MREFIRAIIAILILGILLLIVWNLDVALRAFHAIEEGSFTVARLRLDIASFDLGRKSPVVPVAARTSARDGMPQVFVPAGEFMMGDESRNPDVDSPVHAVYLDAFWMDKLEVTNSMYEKCVWDDGCSLPFVEGNPYYGNWIYRDYPVVYANWSQAKEYCEWAGRRLPTEAEWEKAARGMDFLFYPWGNDPPNPRLANFADALIGEPMPVYRYPLGASPYGVLNMAGNVREWVADWFDAAYYERSPYINPTGPEAGTERSLRSGAYDAQANEILVTSRYRHAPDSAGLSRGFRCAESGE